MSVKIMAAVLLPLSIMGCAQPLRIETNASGAPIAGKQYRWLAPEGEGAPFPDDSRQRMVRTLAARGLTEVSDGGQADYLLLVSHARRPAGTGLAMMAPPPAPGVEPDWLATPGKRGKQLSSLQLRWLDPATGEDVGQFSAQVRHGKRAAPIVLDRLIDGVLPQTP